MNRGLLLLLLAPMAWAGGTVWPWTPGEAPFPQPGAPSSESCGACHEEQYQDWSGSRHHQAWNNDLMMVGYAAEPLPFCVHCHAPGPEAASEILKNQAFYETLAPNATALPGSVQRLPEPHAEGGIGCAVCHWREGAILASGAGYGPHETQTTPEIASGEFCTPCHEFTMPETVDGRTVQTDVLMQATATEWRAWKAAGGKESCQDCHMPGGSHVFRGAHDRAYLRSAVSVQAVRRGGAVVFTLKTQGVGHHMPTGDLFRHMTLEVAGEEGSFTTIRTFGRRFEVSSDGEGLPHKRLAEDTTLRPDEPFLIEHQRAEPVRWRLRWHDGSPRDEGRGLLDLDEIITTLHRGGI